MTIQLRISQLNEFYHKFQECSHDILIYSLLYYQLQSSNTLSPVAGVKITQDTFCRPLYIYLEVP